MFVSDWSERSFIHFPVVGTLRWIPFDGDWIAIFLTEAWLLGNAAACFKFVTADLD